jgi:ParB family chromosome partitioning protein
MENLKLGKGLAELFGEDINSGNIEANIQEIALDKLEAGRFQPRKNIKSEELSSLTESIKEKGVLQPILVRFYHITQKYEIIAGERRYRAAKAAKLSKIPAIILDISEQEAYEIALIENIQREQLNHIEEAEALAKLLSRYGYTQEELAQKLGKSRTHIANMLRLLKLPQEIQTLLINSELSMGHARSLINTKNPLILANEILSKNLTVRETENLVKNVSNYKLAQTNQYDLQKQNYLNKIAAELSDITKLKIQIKHKNNKGKFLIEFTNNQQMDYIIKMFEHLQQDLNNE